MDKQAAKQLIENTFNYPFDIGKYKTLSRNIFKEFDEAEFSREGADYIPKAFISHIKKYARLGTYEDAQGKEIDILIVYINEGIGLDKARTLQRNFISNYLDDLGKDAALVAFTTSDMDDWRFSFITIDYKTIQDESGKIKTKRILSNAKRFSFLVGKNEANHTAKQQVIPLLINSDTPNVEDIEHAFSVEKVTNEFYQDYKKRFLELGYEINRVLDKDEKIKREFERQNIETDNFAKKLMGQIVFLYFVQKKGWLGVGKDDDGNFLKWGEGDKKFMRSLFEKKYCEYNNYFNDVLEPLFYEALATERANNFYSKFECKIPFLSGGLFEAMNGYNWQETDITISNNVLEMILDTFDRYNFTVKEDDPLDKEVAIDPEMLGKVFENLLPENLRKGSGSYYTPRPIVHYMCQESLINYLDTHLDIDKKNISLLIKEGDAIVEHDKIASTKKEGYEGKYQKRMPNIIIENANDIDKLLSKVKICDPAIGSGAFPMGLLHEIVVARNVLTNYIGNEFNRTKFHLKEDCIQNSIYGVDIDEGAIEIAKLRLWLSLIVDEDDIENIKPLPNLDYKIICGNSLISRYELNSPIDVVFSEFNKKLKSSDYKNTAIRNLVGNQEVDLNFYKKISNDFITESSHNKKTIFRQLIDEIKNAFKTEMDNKDRSRLSEARGALTNLSRIDIFGEQQGTNSEIKKAKKKLEKLESQKQEIQDGAIFKNSIEWRFEFPNLLNEDGRFTGFDIVIANPPYVGVKGNSDIFKPIRKVNLGKYFNGRAELFYFFFHLSMEISKAGSIMTFITTNYYQTATSAKMLRNEIKEKSSIIKLINFNELKIFETALGQHNLITILQNGKERDVVSTNIITNRKGVADENILQNIFSHQDTETELYLINQNDIFEGVESYIRMSGVSNDKLPITNILGKLKNNPLLGNICNVRQGLRTGIDRVSKSHQKKYNTPYEINSGVFVLSLNEYNDLCDKFSKEEIEITKILYKNSDIKKYITVHNSEYFIFYTSNINSLNFFRERTPIIYNHLVKYKELIMKIRNSNFEDEESWFKLDRGRVEKMFKEPKIVAPQRSYSNTFGYNDIDWYASSDVYYITSKNETQSNLSLKYILVLLNSRLYYHWLYQKGKRKGEMLELYQKPLSEVPIKITESNIQQKFDLLADKIIDGKKNDEDTTVLEQQVDVMVCKLYELTYEEVLIVDEEFALSEEEYKNFVL